MMTRYRVWLDGLGLHDLDPCLIITDVCESAPRMQLKTAARAQGDGLVRTRRTRQSLSVTVRFLIREYDPMRRQGVMQKLHAWAQGHCLTFSHRPGQELLVTLDAFPTVTSALKWTEELSITFTAYALPYWRSVEPATLTTNASAAMMVEGTAPFAPADVTVTTGGSGTTTAITVQTGSHAITLQRLSLAPGATVVFSYDDQGVLHITSGGASLLSRRTADSADDLLMIPGQSNTVSCSGDQPLTATFAVKGVWA